MRGRPAMVVVVRGGGGVGPFPKGLLATGCLPRDELHNVACAGSPRRPGGHGALTGVQGPLNCVYGDAQKKKNFFLKINK